MAEKRAGGNVARNCGGAAIVVVGGSLKGKRGIGGTVNMNTIIIIIIIARER